MMRALRADAGALVLIAFAAACRTESDGSQFAHPTAVHAAPGPQTPVPLSNETLGAPLADGTIPAEVGELAPDFELVDLDGRVQKLSNYRGKIVVLEWFDPLCPFVIHAYDGGLLREMQSRYATAGIVWLAINSSAADQAGADPALNRAFVASRKLRISIGMDPTGIVGRAYGASTTPQMFVISGRGVLVYAGGLDNAPLGRVASAETRTNFVDAAITDLRSGHAVSTSSTHAYGTAIRYSRPGP